jgi:hypothetical protein
MDQVGDAIVVNDSMQSSYRYVLSAAAGADFAPEFRPVFSPKEMLELGVFEGKYCNDCRPELPEDWFEMRASQPGPMPLSIALASRAGNRSWSGGRKAGSSVPIHEAGSNGIAATTWDAGCRRST